MKGGTVPVRTGRSRPGYHPPLHDNSVYAVIVTVLFEITPFVRLSSVTSVKVFPTLFGFTKARFQNDLGEVSPEYKWYLVTSAGPVYIVM